MQSRQFSLVMAFIATFFAAGHAVAQDYAIDHSNKGTIPPRNSNITTTSPQNIAQPGIVASPSPSRRGQKKNSPQVSATTSNTNPQSVNVQHRGH
jgi:hypothetical protein